MHDREGGSLCFLRDLVGGGLDLASLSPCNLSAQSLAFWGKSIDPPIPSSLAGHTLS